jgi:hypothetical protein
MEDPTHVSQVVDYVIFLLCCYVYVAYKGIPRIGGDPPPPVYTKIR